MGTPSDWVTCRLLLPRWHLSYNVKLEGCVPTTHSQSQLLLHLQNLCRKSSLIDFSLWLRWDGWFLICCHKGTYTWQALRLWIKQDFQHCAVAFSQKKLKFAQFENNSWRRWQQLKEFVWKWCYPLIHLHSTAALCATPRSFEGAWDGFRLLAFLCKQIFMLWYLLWHDVWSSEGDADTFFTVNILCTVLLEHCSCLSYFGRTLSQRCSLINMMKSESSDNCSQSVCPSPDQDIAACQCAGTIRHNPGELWEKGEHSPDWSGALCSENSTLEYPDYSPPKKQMMFQAVRLASSGKSEETLAESLHFAVPARVKQHREWGSPAKECYVPQGTPCWRTFS